MTDKDASSSEPEWTKGIKSETMCQYFYVLFFIIAVFASLILAWDISVVLRFPKIGWGVVLRTLPTLMIAVLNALFLYILCARSLLK